MKAKKYLIAATTVFAAIAGITQDVGPVQNVNNTQTQEKQLPESINSVQTREIKRNDFGGLDFSYDRGLSPKEFGQYLQQNGLQKWNKKKVI